MSTIRNMNNNTYFYCSFVKCTLDQRFVMFINKHESVMHIQGIKISQTTVVFVH